MNRFIIRNDQEKVVGHIDLTTNNAYIQQEFKVTVLDNAYKESIRNFLTFLTPALGIGTIYRHDQNPDLICYGGYVDIVNSLKTPHVEIILKREKLKVEIPKVSDKNFFNNPLPSVTKNGHLIVF